MNFDLQQALDFAESKNSRKIQKDNESNRKKRRVYYESLPTDNLSCHVTDELSNVVSSLTLDMNINPQFSTETSTDCLSSIIVEKDAQSQDNMIDIEETHNNTMNDTDIIENSSNDLEPSNNPPTIDEVLLHCFTNISTEKFCSTLLGILRDAHTCNSQANRLLSFIHSILPIPNTVPRTIERLAEMLEIENYLLTKYMLCTICNTNLSFSDTCCQKCLCSDSRCFAMVYDMDVENLIKKIYIRLKMDIDEYREHLQTSNDRDETNDIGFNKIYQQLSKDNINKNFITFLLHLDGISLTKSSNLKMWLFSGSIIELRPQLRNRRYNMVLFSLWFSYSEPDAQIWLINCIKLIKLIKIKGIKIDHNDRIMVKFLSVTGDNPALRNILNFISHGGYYCCNFCLIHGQHIGNKRQYFYEKKPVLRCSSTYAKETVEAEKTKQIIHGHKGKSILQDILDVKLPEAIIIDYQHASLLRHTKTIFSAIYKQLKPSHREQIDIKLKNQAFPHFFNRRMKPLKKLSFIKAVELRNILMYGFLPLSYEFMNHEQLAHVALFICSIRLYHSQPPLFGRETAGIASQLFEQYYKDIGKFYNLIQHYALHLHSHYGNQYVNYGSLGNIGCFSQEDLLGHISSNTYGTRYYGDQIIRYYNIDFSLNNRRSQAKYEMHFKLLDLSANCIIDNYSIIVEHHNRLCKCLHAAKCISIYRRCMIRNNTFHSLLYKRRTKSNSYFVTYYEPTHNDTKCFGIIHLFFCCASTIYALIQRFKIKEKFISLFKSSSYFDLLEKPLNSCFNIVYKEPTDIFDIVDGVHIIKHCIVFNFGEQLIVTEVSAYHEHD